MATDRQTDTTDALINRIDVLISLFSHVPISSPSFQGFAFGDSDI